MNTIKNKFVKLMIVVSFIMIASSNLFASDVMGGQITWKKVGADSFLVTWVYYRDCNGVPAPTLSIGVKCATTGTTISTLSVTKPSPIDITPTCGSSCNRCQSLGCSFPYGIEKYVFQKLAILSSAGSCCKILLEGNYGKRSGAITTGGANANCYISAQLDRCQSFENNSPQMSYDPINIICVGQDFTINFGAIDSDKDTNGKLLDSISFEWTKPMQTATSYVNWTGSYTYDKPLYFWGFPTSTLPWPRGIQLDIVTGDISFRPMKVETTIIAMKISEWRKIAGTRTKIGETNTDLTVIVISCPNNHPPVLSGPYYKEVNPGDSAYFTIATNDYDTQDTLLIDWSKNISNAIWTSDNHQVKHPTGNIKIPTDSSMTGNTYFFNVNVKDDACPVTGKSIRAYQFYVKPACINKIVSIVKKDLGCNKYVFYPDSFNSGYQYSWEGLTNDIFTSTGDSVMRQYSSFSHFKIRLTTLYSKSCSKSYDLTFSSDSLIKVELPYDTYLGIPDTITLFPITRFAHGKFSFKWNDGDTTNLNKTIDLKGNKQLKFYLTVTDVNGCTSTDSIVIYKNIVAVDLGADKKKCKNNSAQLSYKTINFGTAAYLTTEWYKVGNPTPLSFYTTYNCSDTGLFAVKVNFTSGLVAYDTIHISNYPIPVVDAGSDITVCSDAGLIELIGSPIATSGSTWSGTGVRIIIDKYYFDPHHSSICNGCTYNITYNYKDSFGCNAVTDYKSIKVVYSTIKPEIGAYPNQCLNSPPLKLNANYGSGIWSGVGVNKDYFYPSTAGEGIHQIIYKLGAEPCYKYDTTWITVSKPANVTISTPDNRTEFCIGSGFIPLTVSPSGGILGGDVSYGNHFNADTTAGSYTVYYNYTDSNGCTSVASLVLKTGDPKINISRNDSIFCEGDEIFLNSTSNIDGIKWSTWNTADGAFNSPTDQNNMKYDPGVKDKSARVIRFYLKSTDPKCKFTQDSITVIIADTPEVDFYSDAPVFQGTYYMVKFHDNSKISTSSANYSWSFGNIDFSNLKDPITYYTSLGTYNIELSVSDLNSCKSKEIKYGYVISNLPENIENVLLVYPNPSEDFVNIKSTIPLQEISLYNSLGACILHQQPGNVSEHIIKKQTSGVYLLKVSDVEGKMFTKVLVFY